MKMRLPALAATILALSWSIAGATPPPKPDVQLWRLDCGSIWIANLDDYSDTRAYVGQSRKFVVSCYLIRHGDVYLLWDTGQPKSYLNQPLTQGDTDSDSLTTTVVEQLAMIGVKPAQVSIVGISHYHLDHTGQAIDFAHAQLLIGQKDFEALSQSGRQARAKALAPWLQEGAKIEKVSGDYDVFGDGSAIMLDLPGHTPGHHGLLVQLRKRGAVLLSGDVAHFRDNLVSAGVPPFNVDRVQSLSSMDRFNELARNLNATLIIQHEERDVAKLPAFPEAAE
jgi:N-acyl homoserine lactone hydrolase